MGDHADDALDMACDDLFRLEDLQRSGRREELFDEGFIDERGDLIQQPCGYLTNSTRPKGIPRYSPGGTTCPCCGGAMVLRTNRHTGTKFYGCVKFPNCKGTRST